MFSCLLAVAVGLTPATHQYSVSVISGENTNPSIEVHGPEISTSDTYNRLPHSFETAIDHFSTLNSEDVVLATLVVDNPFLSIDPIETHGIRQPLGEMIRDQNARMIFDLVSRIEDAGGVVTDVFSLTGIVQAKLTRASFFQAIDSVDVIDASVQHSQIESSAGYNGNDSRTALRAQVFLNQGFSGNTGNRINPSLPTIVTTIDGEEMPLNSKGFLDSPNGSNRLFQLWDCAGQNPCQPATFGFPVLGHHHSDAVLSVVGGSIEQGQNSSFPGSGTLSQRQRSGISKETDMIYIKANHTSDVVRALELAWDEDSDVANMPFFAQGLDCDPLANPSSLNSTINLVTGLGLTIVASSGNRGHAQDICSISYPSLRPNVLSVGHLETQLSPTPSYAATSMATASSLGGLPIVVSGFGAQVTSGIGLVAPGQRKLYQTGLTSYSTGTAIGSSIASSAVSGLLANIIDGYGGSLPSIHNTYTQRSLLYLMGDGCESHAALLKGMT
jgi:hypothetical protein